jgi:hypothetical protein
MPDRLKIAFSPDLGYARVQKDVAVWVEKAVHTFETMGHTVNGWTGSLPEIKPYCVQSKQSKSLLGRF